MGAGVHSYSWRGLSFDAPSRGVVACDGRGHGAVLWAIGAHLLFELEECCLSELADLGLDDAPAGISVWEGKYVWESGEWELPEDGLMQPKGAFRAPTDEEWSAIRAGKCPWPETLDAYDIELINDHLTRHIQGA